MGYRRVWIVGYRTQGISVTGVRVVRSLNDCSLGCIGAVSITKSFKVSDEAGAVQK